MKLSHNFAAFLESKARLFPAVAGLPHLRRTSVAAAAVGLAVSISLAMPVERAEAGLLTRLGAVAAVGVGYEYESIANATVNAVVAAGTPSYQQIIAGLQKSLLSHKHIGPAAVRHGLKKSVKLYPTAAANAAQVAADLGVAVTPAADHSYGDMPWGSSPR